jgi:hypothetical protein
MKTITLEIEINDTDYALLEVLTRESWLPSVAAVIHELIDHVQQGIYRPGAWERRWVIQAFGDEFIQHLEMGDPHAEQRQVPFAYPELKESQQRPSDADVETWLDSFKLCPFDQPKGFRR